MTAAAIDPAEFEVQGSCVVEVVATYAGLVFDARHCAHGYTVGDGPRASFPLLSLALPDPHCFPLMRRDDGATWLRFTADMRGGVDEVAGRSSLDMLIASGRAVPVDGAFTLELAPGASAEIRIEAVSFSLREVPQAACDRSTGFERRWWPRVGLMSVVLGAACYVALL